MSWRALLRVDDIPKIDIFSILKQQEDKASLAKGPRYRGHGCEMAPGFRQAEI
jgi:hypothetical protein